MARAFITDPSGSIVGWMEPVELELVIDTVTSTRDLLVDATSAPSAPADEHDELFASLTASMQERDAPQDPALRRLLPDAGGDAEASAEFRRLTEDGLRRQKSSRLDLARTAFERALADGADGEQRVELTREEARAAMMALTDVRLVLAERLGVHTDADAEALHEHVESMEIPSSERDVTAMYYDFVTWLAESLTVAYLGQA